VTDIVRFSNTPIVFTKAGFLFTTTVNKLRCILPYAEFQHVGSTAIPGTLTKGDLDIVVRVSPEHFCEADLRLAELFERNTGSFQSNEFSAFQDVTSDPELGVQLVAIGSDADHFHVWRQLLESDAELRCKYDELKRSFEGQSMELYREAKAQFITDYLGGQYSL
jgi:GrpB-like predicted nucleotidyltransferase (UPF0157 family)